MFGRRPSLSDFLKMMLMGSARTSAVSANRMVGMSSGPAAFPTYQMTFHKMESIKNHVFFFKSG
jgi:hypothetical protein